MKTTALKSNSLRTSPAKQTSTKASPRKPVHRTAPAPQKSDRATLIAFYLFAASMVLGLLYFLSLVFFI